ncbi:hypothetical protein ACFY7C_00145 [Streptomyces sp. NPDC012769]|uniref:hypothetical protein n=1 Tax=Streptomyces sp. NPDC012769 TaxID=3364848 RepID=UPI003699442D
MATGLGTAHAAKQIDRTALREPLVARTIRGRDLVTGAVVGVARITGSHQDPDGSAGSSDYQKLRNARVAAGGLLTCLAEGDPVSAI